MMQSDDTATQDDEAVNPALPPTLPLPSDPAKQGADANEHFDASTPGETEAQTLHSKTSARSRTSTPRPNVVFPDVIENSAPPSIQQLRDGLELRQSDDHSAPTLSSRSNPRSIPPSARKYAVDDPEIKATSTSPGARKLPAPASATISRENVKSTRHRPSLMQFVPSTASVRGSVSMLARELPIRLKKAAHSSRHAYNQASLQQVIAYSLIIAAMVSEAFTPVPRHNAPIGVLLFVVPASQLPHRLVVSGLGAGLLLDIFWLLRPQEASYNGYFAANYVSASQLALAACAFIKIWLIFSAYFDLHEVEEPEETTKRGRRATTSPLQPGSHRLWDQIKYIFPRKTLPKRSHLSFEVLMRVLALVWLHGVLGVLLLTLALIASSSYTTRPQFRAKPLGLPLHIAMLLKSATTLLAYFCTTHRMSYHGCMALTVGGVNGFRANRNDVVLKYNKVWLQRVQRAKALDTFAGVYTLLALFLASHQGEGVATLEVQMLMGFTAVALLALELWAPLLILTAAKCGSRLHELHRLGEDGVDDPYFPNQIQWSDEENDSDDDDDNDDSDGQDDDDDSDENSDDDEEEEDESDGTRRPSAISLRERQGRRRISRQSSQKVSRSRQASQQRLLREEDEDESGEEYGGNKSARRSSLAIVDSSEFPASKTITTTTATTSSEPVWVRHFDPSSGKPFLVHSVTGESVWEIVPSRGADESDLNGESDAAIHLHGKKSARISSREPSQGEAMRSSRSGSRSAQHQQQESASLTATFDNEWREFGVDSGAFSCRVSRVPSPNELSAHLARQGFAFISDDIVELPDGDHRRVARFWAAVDENASTLFLGEFTLDSLSLTLRAAFRCPRAEAVVGFVRRLQLKEIVGAYTPIAAS